MSSQGRSSRKSHQQFDDGDLMLEERPARSSTRRALSALRSMMAAHAVLTTIVAVMVVAAFVMAVSALVRVKNTTELTETTQQGLPGALLRIDALEQTDAWMANQTAAIFDDIDSLNECCVANTAQLANHTTRIGTMATAIDNLASIATNHTTRIGLVQTIINNFATVFTTLRLVVTGNATVTANVTIGGTLSVGGNITGVNQTLTGTLTTRSLIVTNQTLADLARVSFRLVVLSCSDIGNTSVIADRNLAFYQRVWAHILSVVGATNATTATPTLVAHLGDTIYSDSFEPDWLENWFATHPNVNVSNLGRYSQVDGYWLKADGSGPNYDQGQQLLDNFAYKMSLYPAVPAWATLRAQNRFIGMWDDHDSGPNNNGANFYLLNVTKTLFAQTMGTRGWVYPLPDLTHGIYSLNTATLPTGETVEIYCLDDQFYRTPAAVIAAQNRTWDDPANAYFGTEQLAWLERKLLASGATYRIIMAGGPMFYGGNEDDTNIAQNYYAMEQFFMTNLIRRLNLQRTIFVGGDRHINAVLEDRRLTEVPIISITASGMGWNSAARLDPRLPEFKWGNVRPTLGSFTVIDVLSRDIDPTIQITVCQSTPTGVSVINQYSVPVRHLEAARPVPALTLPIEVYATYFSLTVIDSRNASARANQLVTPALFSMIDLNTSTVAVPSMELTPIGTIAPIIVGELLRDIRMYLTVGHTYNITITLANVVDWFVIGPLEPWTPLVRRFINVFPPPIDTSAMTTVLVEDFSTYTVGQTLIFANRSGAPNAPNWSGDLIKFTFVDPVPYNIIVAFGERKNLLAQSTGSFAAMQFHPPIMNTLNRTSYSQVYMEMRVLPSLQQFDGVGLRFLPFAYWDPVGNPASGGPGVVGVETIFATDFVRSTSIAAGGSLITSTRVTAAHPIIPTVDSIYVIEILMDFDTNLMTLAINGITWVSTAPLDNPSALMTGFAGWRCTAGQTITFTDITVKAKPR